jgi:NADPH2:quinone reductase
MENVLRPRLAPDEVLIRNEAMALNFSDLFYLRNEYLVETRLPAVLGMEGAGTVVEVGDEVTGVAMGDRVAYIGLGAFAEFKKIKAGRAIPLPDAMTFEEGAAFPVAALTAWHTLHTLGRLKGDDVVVIHSAAGGVGIAAVQIARATGAKVIGVTSTKEKADLVRAVGAHLVLDYNSPFGPRIAEATSGRGADLILDSVGLPTFDAGLNGLAPFGRLVLFGRAGGLPEPLDPMLLLPRSLTVSAFNLPMTYAHAELHEAAVKGTIDLALAGKLRLPIGGRFDLSHATEALTLLAERRTTGKILLFPDG